MYAEYYGLSLAPFQLTPDDRFFFASRPHRKALSYLNYGLSKGEGFVVVTGEVGAGKTTILAHLRASLQDPRLRMAWLTTTQVTADDLIRLITAAFGLSAEAPPGDKATLLRRIEDFLQRTHHEGKRACLVIDEAQSLLAGSLEELRMLSNFQSGSRALLQIFLVGQPEFRKLIQREDLEQLRQRVVVSFHLTPLDAGETRTYIEHRLRVAGWEGEPVFADPVFDRVFAHTSGVPRKINLLCDRLLLHGFLAERTRIDFEDADAVIAELEGELRVVHPEETLGVSVPAPRDPGGASGPAGLKSSPPALSESPLREPDAPQGQEAGWRQWTSANDKEEEDRERSSYRWVRWAVLFAAAIGFALLVYGLARLPAT